MVAAALIVTVTAAMFQSPSKMCVIDLGSNTFRRIVGSFEGGRYEQTKPETRPVGVGEDVASSGTISAPKLATIEQVLSAYKATCDRQQAAPIVAVGTAAFRDASNGRDVVAIARRLGIAMEIASEARESELAYLVGSLGADGYAVIDNGSRSVELVARNGGAAQHSVFNLGYRLAYEEFFAKADDANPAITAFRERLLQEAKTAPFMKGKKKLVGVEFGEMASVLFKATQVEGRIFTLTQLKQKVDEIRMLRREQFASLKKIDDIDRALPRLIVATVLMESFGYQQIELTERELGAGLIIERGLAGR
jgi:exopolyphosphatase/guanosine-5'-triphosphate,3'-diphosphate pyrophosphatase